MYKQTIRVTKELILSKITEEQIFEYYLGILPNTDKIYRNPLRIDNEPGCKFYVSNSVLRFKDFATGFNEDCWGIVQYKYNINFPSALEKIAADFGLFNYSNRIYTPKSIIKIDREQKDKAQFRIRFRKWNKIDANYWRQFYISSETLSIFNVKPVQLAWKEEFDSPFYIYTENNPCYCYIFPNKTIKLYSPFAEKGKKFYTNSQYIQGINNLPQVGEDLIITKSYKDVIAMYMFGINAIAPPSELFKIPLDIMLDLKSRFRNIYTLYDWDRAGIKGALNIRKEYGIPPLFFTKGDKVRYNYEQKDFCDNLKTYGYQDMIDIISYTKTKIYFNDMIDSLKIPF